MRASRYRDRHASDTLSGLRLEYCTSKTRVRTPGKLGKSWSRDYDPIDVPGMPSLRDAHLRYQEAFDWRKWTKGKCSSLLLSAQFCHGSSVQVVRSAIRDTGDPRSGFEPRFGQPVVTRLGPPDDVPTMPALPNLNANLQVRYQEALNWRKWTPGQKEDVVSFFCPRSFDRAARVTESC